MNKSAGDLDQALIESVTRGVALGQPKLLEHIVRFIKELLIEALEVTEIVRVQGLLNRFHGVAGERCNLRDRTADQRQPGHGGPSQVMEV